MAEENKKQKIYGAVMQLFKEGKNIKSIKVSDIADRAGIGKGSIYLHFASKNEVIIEAAKYFFDTWLRPFNEFVIDKDKDFKQIVMEFMDVHLDLFEEYSKFLNPERGSDYINVFNSDTLPGTIEIARKARLEYLEIVEKILNLGKEQKAITYINRYSINVVAEAMMLMVKYLGFKEVLDEDIKYSDELCKDLTYDMILRVCK